MLYREDNENKLDKPLPPTKSGGNMEHDLHQRDRVGVQDFVLIEDFQNEQAFIDNLRKRFRENLIYVSKINFISISYN